MTYGPITAGEYYVRVDVGDGFFGQPDDGGHR